MDSEKRILYSVVFAVALVFVSAMASAGLKDFFLSPEGSKQVTVGFAGINPVQTIIHNESLNAVIPNIGAPLDLEFIVELIDINGASDINETSTNASFSNGVTGGRHNSTCNFNGQSSEIAKNFSCTVTMWYFDENAVWTIRAGGRDIGNKTYRENMSTFNYGQRRSFVVDNDAIQFNTLGAGGLNEEAINNPAYINNTGNYIVPFVSINGTNLPGQISGEFGVGNFSARVNGGSACSTGNSLSHGLLVAIGGSGFSPGNLSTGSGTGQQTLNFCIPVVPINLLTQQYSTTFGGSPWVIDIQ